MHQIAFTVPAFYHIMKLSLSIYTETSALTRMKKLDIKNSEHTLIGNIIYVQGTLH